MHWHKLWFYWIHAVSGYIYAREGCIINRKCVAIIFFLRQHPAISDSFNASDRVLKLIHLCVMLKWDGQRGAVHRQDYIYHAFLRGHKGFSASKRSELKWFAIVVHNSRADLYMALVSIMLLIAHSVFMPLI